MNIFNKINIDPSKLVYSFCYETKFQLKKILEITKELNNISNKYYGKCIISPDYIENTNHMMCYDILERGCHFLLYCNDDNDFLHGDEEKEREMDQSIEDIRQDVSDSRRASLQEIHQLYHKHIKSEKGFIAMKSRILRDIKKIKHIRYNMNSNRCKSIFNHLFDIENTKSKSKKKSKPKMINSVCICDFLERVFCMSNIFFI